MAKSKITPELLKQLAAEGYQVKKKVELVRKTFVVEKPVLDAFIDAVEARDMKVQDAANEALRDWTGKKR